MNNETPNMRRSPLGNDYVFYRNCAACDGSGKTKIEKDIAGMRYRVIEFDCAHCKGCGHTEFIQCACCDSYNTYSCTLVTYDWTGRDGTTREHGRLLTYTDCVGDGCRYCSGFVRESDMDTVIATFLTQVKESHNSAA
uniref:Uncharacterized protein n=1 Tax=viral metagenome TaxID=1070528 RepID=A0A2V0RAK1_9ZZZZ